MIGLIVAGETVFALPFHVARFFRPIVLDVFGGALSDIDAPNESRERLGRDYLATIERLGLT